MAQLICTASAAVATCHGDAHLGTGRSDGSEGGMYRYGHSIDWFKGKITGNSQEKPMIFMGTSMNFRLIVPPKPIIH